MDGKLLILALLVTLGACASAPASSSFNPSSQNALVILATPVNQSNNLDVLRRVDLDTGHFVGPPVVVSVQTYGGLDHMFSARNQINADNSLRTVALALQEVPPGDYAWVESVRTAGSSIYGWVGIQCFNEISPVFSFAAGEMAIVRVDGLSLGTGGSRQMRWTRNGNAPADASVVAEFELARSNFPGLVGSAVVREPGGFIRWARTDGISLNRNCREPETFERIPSPQ